MRKQEASSFVFMCTIVKWGVTKQPFTMKQFLNEIPEIPKDTIKKKYLQYKQIGVIVPIDKKNKDKRIRFNKVDLSQAMNELNKYPEFSQLAQLISIMMKKNLGISHKVDVIKNSFTQVISIVADSLFANKPARNFANRKKFVEECKQIRDRTCERLLR